MDAEEIRITILNEEVGFGVIVSEYKHWLQIDVNGRFLVDPVRNSTTFRPIFPR